MTRNLRIALFLVGAFVVVGAAYGLVHPRVLGPTPEATSPATSEPSPTSTVTPTEAVTPTPSPSPTLTSVLVAPIDGFAERITRKPFGIYITPATSPVQPEKFTGYHTGVDVEYTDVPGDVTVRAIADGEVLVSRTASGYGGVVVIRHIIKGQPRPVVYGHLDPQSLLSVGIMVTKGQQIGVLGDHASSETDGERKHLHFAVRASNTVDLRGYVQAQSELSGWMNPTVLFE